MHLSKRITLLFASLLLLLIGIPLTLSLMRQTQDTRTKAAAATTVSFIPQPGPSASITKNIGDTVPIDIILDPTTNAVTILRVQFTYDKTKLEPVTDPFTLNISSRFSTSFAPVISDGTGLIILTTGTDPNNAVRTAGTKVGTITFKTIGSTDGGQTPVSFVPATGSTGTQAFSVAAGDGALENVISNRNPAQITINGPSGPTATPTPTPSTGTKLTFVVLLHGIGKSGDTPNPEGNSLSNKNPKHPERELTAEIYDNTDQQVAVGTGIITYVTNSDDDQEIGAFKGTVTLNNSLATGKYIVKVKTDRYLRKAFPGTITLSGIQENKLPIIDLVAGDTDNDNILNIIDYNALLDCGYGSLNPLPITNSNAQYNSGACKTHEPRINIDLEDNGIVNAYDYNLFIRELSVQSGD